MYNSSGSGSDHQHQQQYQYDNQAHALYNNTSNSLDMTVDRDMFMALGIEQDALAPIEVGNGNDNVHGLGDGSTEGLVESSGERDWTELDFDSWVNGLSGTY
jgi:hypothetical protein